MKDKSISHVGLEPESRILPGGPGHLPKRLSIPTFFEKNRKKSEKRRNRKIRLDTYVRNRFIFHLQVVSSKNIEN